MAIIMLAAVGVALELQAVLVHLTVVQALAAMAAVVMEGKTQRMVV
jgi:hypothetical protein